jgi:hypothetical protein
MFKPRTKDLIDTNLRDVENMKLHVMSCKREKVKAAHKDFGQKIWREENAWETCA